MIIDGFYLKFKYKINFFYYFYKDNKKIILICYLFLKYFKYQL